MSEKWVRVMADYCSTAIWHKDGYPLDYNEVPISKELADKLEEWVTFYDTNCTDYYPEDNEKFKPFDFEDFAAKGLVLAKQLKQELPDWTVIYHDESKHIKSRHREYEIL